MVESGESQLFNCTASCTDPEKLVLETELNNILLEPGSVEAVPGRQHLQGRRAPVQFHLRRQAGDESFNITVFCEWSPTGPAPRAAAWVCKPNRQALSLLLGTVLWSHLPGLLDPGHGLRICSLLPWPPRTPPATGILSLLRSEQSKA